MSYFNTLTLPTIYTRISSGPTNGLFNAGIDQFSSVPVNYFAPTPSGNYTSSFGTHPPGDSNLIYIDFSFPTPPVIDTNLPTVSLTYPTASNPVTNRQVTMTGTASDDFGIARVVATITSPQGATGEATGTTNWSFNFGNLAPGTTSVYIVAQDGAGNLSTPLQTSFVMPQYPVNVTTNGPGTLSTNLTTATTTFGSNYVVKAIPNKGRVCSPVGWKTASVFLNPTNSFSMPNGLDLSALFVPNTMPGGISFTYPPPNGKVAATNFAVTGKIARSAGQTTVTARIFSTNNESVTEAMTASGTQTWSIPSVQLAPGDYFIQAIASNTLGQTTVITKNFTVLAPLKVNIIGPGSTSIADGTYFKLGTTNTIRATAKAGGTFYALDSAQGHFVEPAIPFVMANGTSIFTATFITNALPKTLSFTYPAPNSQVTTTNFTITGNVSGSVKNPQVLCEIFLGAEQVGEFLYAPLSTAPRGRFRSRAFNREATPWWRLPRTPLGHKLWRARISS